MIYFLIFIFGACLGSFLNVVILRLRSGQVCRPEEKESIVCGRSHCVKCGRILRWYDLIPIISFFALRARCRDCGQKISWQYPLVEIATGALFVLVAANLFPELVEGSRILAFDSSAIWQIRSGNIIGALCFFYLISSLIVIFVYDLRHYIIPDVVLFPAIGVTFVSRVVIIFSSAPLRSGTNLFPELVEGFKVFSPYLISALGATAFFLAIILITRGKGMGLGDAKLAFLMGLVLGWPNILIALLLAFFIGATVGVGLIIRGAKTMKSQIPFGPFLVAGTLIALFGGRFFLDWYGIFFF